ncbi:MAG: hypothetical protein DDT19_01232 [Syntrophomonadaceae bacterium]|nr:hypothetical protein [Bacillota bacterium]
MTEIKFNVRFITPLLIHGSDPRFCDSIGLTGKALRGSWRFWFRAMIGGMVPNISKDDLLKLEGNVFGSSNEKIGAKFRMVIEKINATEDRIKGGFKKKDRNGNATNKDQLFAGYEEGSEFLIKILPRKNIDLNVLLSTIWLWGNLGAVGQRQRRGFGSLSLKLINTSNPFQEKIGLPINLQFANQNELRQHLCNNLPKVWDILEGWLKGNGCSVVGNIITNSPPDNRNPAPYFILKSIGQVAVGDSPYTNWERAITAIHGDNKCNGLGYATRNGRQASPVFTSLHKVNNGYIPVATYANQNLPNCKSHDCVKNYLINASFIQWLDGSAI